MRSYASRPVTRVVGMPTGKKGPLDFDGRLEFDGKLDLGNFGAAWEATPQQPKRKRKAPLSIADL